MEKCKNCEIRKEDETFAMGLIKLVNKTNRRFFGLVVFLIVMYIVTSALSLWTIASITTDYEITYETITTEDLQGGDINGGYVPRAFDY